MVKFQTLSVALHTHTHLWVREGLSQPVRHIERVVNVLLKNHGESHFFKENANHILRE